MGSIGSALRVTSTAQSAGGFQWRYDEGDYSDISALHVNGRPVLQINPNTYELIAEYSSMADAARTTGVSNKQIIKSCQRIHITSGGFIWRYKDDLDAFVPVEKKEQIYHTIPICKYSLDGKFICAYESIADAERDNPKVVGIGAVVNSKLINKSAGGFMWQHDDGNHDDIRPYHANGRCVEQIDLIDGSVINKYPSIKKAQKETGINNIGAVCSGKRKNAGGFIWCYSDDSN